jgi:anaerobic selenocysteine-containing dehydrogenase
VEISLEDARRLGIEDGETVIVESPLAQVEMRAEVRAGIRPGCSRCPWAPDQGRRILPCRVRASLLASVVDATSGHWFAYATRAQVRKGA